MLRWLLFRCVHADVPSRAHGGGFEMTVFPLLDEWPLALHEGGDYERPVRALLTGRASVGCLAEADIPYTDLVEMDEINSDMPQCDVALVVGANDVVNPAARYDKTSPIFSMPIIDADKARTVFAIKRSKNPGFAGIDNELYFSDRTWMLFGDAKQVVGELVKQLSAGSGMH
jgi:NAD(P) transhydrogenase subunit beta